MKTWAPIAVVVCISFGLIAVRSGHTDDGQSRAEGASSGAAEAKSNETTAKQATPEKAKSQAKKVRGRLPNYYGRLGLSGEQRETIYGIQAEYRDELEELEKQIDALKSRRDQEIEAVLTPVQKELLDRMLEEAKQKREARKKSKAAPDSP